MNRLKDERSPYLLQHADNPVDWMPWRDEVFDLAKKEDKPIFLSIGYSTCHWCHVMERESFEDGVVASLLNRVFVCIKVDREERPDIDKIYMNIAQMITGRGGWPLSIFMTPQKKPFFAATYIPREDRPGQLGLLTLIPRIEDLWKNKKDEIIQSAADIVDKLASIKEKPGESMLNAGVLDKAFKEFTVIYDSKHGGFGNAPKFPSTHNLSFLLNYWKKTNNPEALNMVTDTLDHMRYGGIWDHIGYGFHRYSTDRQWTVPHFEKMLYDQAIISHTYMDAYQATGKGLYSKTVEQIFDYVLKNITSENGGFFSAEDADSEGVEGKFYLWTNKELEHVLAGNEASLIGSLFNISKPGNYTDEATGKKTGNNILNITESYDSLSQQHGMDSSVFESKLNKILKKLNKIREKRIRPFRDDKILTDWNGLMASAFARGGMVLGKQKYVDIAKKAIDFVFSKMSAKNGKLYHNYSGGQSSIDANLDDYAFMIMALIELYQATFDYEYIKKADTLNTVLNRYFWDNESGGYFYSSSENKDLIMREKDSYDGAVPSGNSISILNLIKLGRIKMDKSLEKKAVRITGAFSGSVDENPASHSQFLRGVDFLIGDSYEIIIVPGKNTESVDKILKSINRHYIPNRVIILSDGNNYIPEFMRNLKTIDGKTTVYVCKNYYCKLPTTSETEVMKLLDIK